MKKKLAVILLTFKRQICYQPILANLALQTNKDFDLYVLNNNKQLDHVFSRTEFFPSKRFFYEAHDNSLGCLLRFVRAQELASQYEYFIFLDDDHIYPDNFIQTLLEAAEKNTKTISCTYACMLKDYCFNYFSPYAIKPNEYGNYAGVCGSCISSEFFANTKFQDYKHLAFADDVLFSFFLSKAGYKILACDTQMIGTNDHTHALVNQRAVRRLRREFLWKMIEEESWPYPDKLGRVFFLRIFYRIVAIFKP